MAASREVPIVVQRKAIAVGAGSWLDSLPALVEQMEREWSIAVGRPYEDATEAFVAEARLADGTPAVLKLVVPRDGGAAVNEITVLELAAGHGCAALLRSAPEHGALLVERLGRSLFQMAVPLGRRHEILCDTAQRVWRPAPGCGLPTGASKAARLIELVTAAWEELDRPCSERAVAEAIEAADRRRRAHDDERAVLVHGDVHQWNVLEAGAAGFKLVDPDGVVAEAECDLGVLMREDPLELLADDPWSRARWLARRTGLDAQAIWEWGTVERVSTGLLGTRVGLQPVASQMLQVADLLAQAR